MLAIRNLLASDDVKRVVAVLVAALALVLGFQASYGATPAKANHPPDVLTFGVPTQGTADVAEEFVGGAVDGETTVPTVDDCWDNVTGVQGDGLYAPAMEQSPQIGNLGDGVVGSGIHNQFNERTGAYVFQAPIVSRLAAGHGGQGNLKACGDLAGENLTPQGIGAACGSSSSTGVARAEFPDGTQVDSNYSWEQTAGGTLPITGTWVEGTNSGQLVGVVNAQGGADCFDPSGVRNTGGADQFSVSGVIVLN